MLYDIIHLQQLCKQDVTGVRRAVGLKREGVSINTVQITKQYEKYKF